MILKTSIAVTTKRRVGEWGDTLRDTIDAAAMLHRPLHRTVLPTLTAIPTSYETITPAPRTSAKRSMEPTITTANPTLWWTLSEHFDEPRHAPRGAKSHRP